MMRRGSIDNDAERAVDDVRAGIGHKQYQHAVVAVVIDG
jgi:hypothetical protein